MHRAGQIALREWESPGPSSRHRTDLAGVSRVLSSPDLVQLGLIMSPDPGAIFAYLKRRQHGLAQAA